MDPTAGERDRGAFPGSAWEKGGGVVLGSHGRSRCRGPRRDEWSRERVGTFDRGNVAEWGAGPAGCRRNWPD